MKRLFLYAVPIISIFILAVSCTNEKIDISKQVTITVSPASVLTGFTPYRSSDMDMYSDDNYTAGLRLTTLIYDDSGKLVEEKETLVSDYSQTYSFQTILPDNGNFKVIAFCSSIIGSLSKPDYESYSISGKDRIENIKIVRDDGFGDIFWAGYSNFYALGYGLTDLATSTSSNVSVILKPCVSYVTFRWTDIHANDSELTTIYGDFTASTEDYWGNDTYNWTVTIEQDGNSSTDVIIRNLDPFFVKYGLTADKEYNTFRGTFDGTTICIPAGQSTGLTAESGNAVLLEGISKIDDSYLYFGDLYIDIADGRLITRNMFGTCDPDEDGWYSLYNQGIVFSPTSTTGGIDQYRLFYHANDVVTCVESSVSFSTTLGEGYSFFKEIEPAKFESSSSSVYEPDFLLPGTFNIFGRTIVGSKRTDYSEQKVSIDMGKQYVFEFDCKNLKVVFRDGTLLTKSSGNDYTPKRIYREKYPMAYKPKRINLFED